MVTTLTLESKYIFVTTEEQAKELLKLSSEKPESLKGLLAFLDSNLVVSGRHSYRLTVALTNLVTRSRQLGMCFVVVKNPETNLDKRIISQLTHTAGISAKEIRQRSRRL